MEKDVVLMKWWDKELQLMMACAIEASCNPSGERAPMGNNRQQWETAATGIDGQ